MRWIKMMMEPCRERVREMGNDVSRRQKPSVYIYIFFFCGEWACASAITSPEQSQTHSLRMPGMGSFSMAVTGSTESETSSSIRSDLDGRLLSVILWRQTADGACDTVVFVLTVVAVVELLLLASRWKLLRNWCVACRLWWPWWILVAPRDAVRFCDGWSDVDNPSAAQQFHPGHKPIEWTAFSSLTASHSSAGIFLVSNVQQGRRTRRIEDTRTWKKRRNYREPSPLSSSNKLSTFGASSFQTLITRSSLINYEEFHSLSENATNLNIPGDIKATVIN